MPDATDDLLAIQDLETQFHVGQRIYRAVGGVSLAVKPGECLGVIGESRLGQIRDGARVMGLVASPPGVITGGAVRFQGEDLIGAPYESLRRKRGDRVAYIFQDPLSTLHPLYRVGQQLAEAIQSHHKVQKAEARERAIQLLEGRAHSQRRKPGRQLTRTRCQAACASVWESRWRWPMSRT